MMTAFWGPAHNPDESSLKQQLDESLGSFRNHKNAVRFGASINGLRKTLHGNVPLLVVFNNQGMSILKEVQEIDQNAGVTLTHALESVRQEVQKIAPAMLKGMVKRPADPNRSAYELYRAITKPKALNA